MVKPSKPFCAVDKFEQRFVKPFTGRTLIVGSFVTEGKEDRRKHYTDAVGIDMRPGPGVDRVLNLEDPLPADIGRFAHIECCSVMEHSRRPWLLAANVEQMLDPGGTLYVLVPFVWRFHDYPSDYWRMTAEAVRSLFPAIDWTALMYASDRLRDDHFLSAKNLDGHAFLPRCEVVGFGVKR